jgi:hypothetical protein
MPLPPPIRIRILALAAVAALSCTSPALAGSEPSTRLVSCRSGSCLVVSGHRDSPSAAVLINGHAVAVEGARRWRISLPVETIRAWSEPLARSIEVATIDATTQDKTAAEADLPIGLLGHAELTSVVVAMK